MAGKVVTGYRAALRQRDFRLLVISAFVDSVGSWAYSIVLSVYVFDRTHSTWWLAVIPTSRWLTNIVVGPYGGVIADRYQRTRLMVGSALINAVLASVLTVVVAVNAPVVLLPIICVVMAAVGSPYEPAAAALTPEVVDEAVLGAANSLFSALENLVVVIGPAIGGLLLLTGLPAIAVGLDAASFLVAAVLISRLRVRSVGAGEAGGNVRAQLRQGVQAALGRRTTLFLMIYMTIDTAIYGASTVLFVPLSRHLGTGSTGSSYLLAAGAAGGVLAAGLANRLGLRRQLAPVIVGSLMLQALPYAATVLTHTPVVAAVLQLMSGAGMIIVDVIAMTALQTDTPPGLRGRVLSLLFTALAVGTVIASFLASASLALFGLHTTLLVVGLGFSALGLLGSPVLVRADRDAAARRAALAPTVELLAGLDLFTGITSRGLETLAEAATAEQFDPRAVLIREGDDADALFVLTSGRLRVRTGAQGRRRDVVAPAYVGEVGLLRHIARTATVTASGPAEVLRISGDAFASAAAATPPSRTMLETAAARFGPAEPR